MVFNFQHLGSPKTMYCIQNVSRIHYELFKILNKFSFLFFDFISKHKVFSGTICIFVFEFQSLGSPVTLWKTKGSKNLLRVTKKCIIL